jgi:hypothetical protein
LREPRRSHDSAIRTVSWDSVEGRAALPRAAATLGLELIDFDDESGTIELAFRGTEDGTNPTGPVGRTAS